LFFQYPYAQKGGNPLIDSLETALKVARDDTNKVNLLNRLGYRLRYNSNHSTALQYEYEAIALAKKLDFKSGVGRLPTGTLDIFTTTGVIIP